MSAVVIMQYVSPLTFASKASEQQALKWSLKIIIDETSIKNGRFLRSLKGLGYDTNVGQVISFSFLSFFSSKEILYIRETNELFLRV